MGNYNNSHGLVPNYATNPSNKSAPAACSLHGFESPTCSINGTRNLEVEGVAFIRTLQHGFPAHKVGAAHLGGLEASNDKAVEVVEDEPIVSHASPHTPAAFAELAILLPVSTLRGAYLLPRKMDG